MNKQYVVNLKKPKYLKNLVYTSDLLDKKAEVLRGNRGDDPSLEEGIEQQNTLKIICRWFLLSEIYITFQAISTRETEIFTFFMELFFCM